MGWSLVCIPLAALMGAFYGTQVSGWFVVFFAAMAAVFAAVPKVAARQRDRRWAVRLLLAGGMCSILVADALVRTAPRDSGILWGLLPVLAARQLAGRRASYVCALALVGWVYIDLFLPLGLPVARPEPDMVGSMAMIDVAGTLLLLTLFLDLFSGAEARIRERLSREVAERRAAEEKAEQAREAALALAESKAAFLGVMSHEIRTPLNGILGIAEALEDGADEVERAELLGLLGHSARALLGIVNDVLDLAKLDAGKMPIIREPFDLQASVRTINELVRHGKARPGVRLTASSDLPSPWMRGDASRVSQVLTNLIGNAAKFTEEGAIETHVRANGPDQLRIEVRDTGIGIAADRLEALFQPFEQASQTTAKRYGGTGLGLAICRRLVHAMGGEIGVESTPGQGSTFWFTLPYEPCPAPEPEGGGRKLSGRVLIVDDDATNRRILARAVERLGLEVISAESGESAVDRAGTVDLVLMDVEMPGIGGLEATRRIRSARPELPVIGLSGHDPDTLKPVGDAAGMVGYLSKPLNRSALGALLQNHLGD